MCEGGSGHDLVDTIASTATDCYLPRVTCKGGAEGSFKGPTLCCRGDGEEEGYWGMCGTFAVEANPVKPPGDLLHLNVLNNILSSGAKTIKRRA